MRSWRQAMLAIASLVLVLSLPPAAASAAPKKPDLTVKAGRSQGPSFTLIRERYRLRISDTTVNEGKRTSSPTTTDVVLEHGGDLSDVVSIRQIPGLSPGDKDKGSPRNFQLDNAPAGEYRVLVCVDLLGRVEESNERNNCEKVSGKHYSAYAGYKGTLIGAGWGASFTPDTIEQWTSQNAGFEFDQYLGGGVFSYGPQGSVTYTQGGSHNGCTYSGTGSQALGPTSGTAIVDHANEKYTASLVAGFAAYSIQQDCGGTVTTLEGPTTSSLLETSPTGNELRWGERALRGSGADLFNANFEWNLRGTRR